MAKKKKGPDYVHAYNPYRLDKDGNPIKKKFTGESWRRLRNINVRDNKGNVVRKEKQGWVEDASAKLKEAPKPKKSAEKK